MEKHKTQISALDGIKAPKAYAVLNQKVEGDNRKIKLLNTQREVRKAKTVNVRFKEIGAPFLRTSKPKRRLAMPPAKTIHLILSFP